MKNYTTRKKKKILLVLKLVFNEKQREGEKIREVTIKNTRKTALFFFGDQDQQDQRDQMHILKKVEFNVAIKHHFTFSDV